MYYYTAWTLWFHPHILTALAQIRESKRRWGNRVHSTERPWTDAKSWLYVRQCVWTCRHVQQWTSKRSPFSHRACRSYSCATHRRQDLLNFLIEEEMGRPGIHSSDNSQTQVWTFSNERLRKNIENSLALVLRT